MVTALTWSEASAAILLLAARHGQESAEAVSRMLARSKSRPLPFDVPGRSEKLTLCTAADWSVGINSAADFCLVALQQERYLLLARNGETRRWHVVGSNGEELSVLPEEPRPPRHYAGWLALVQLPLAEFDSEISEQVHALDSVVNVITFLWRKYRRRWLEIMGATLLINFSALLVPLYSMTVYDKIIGNATFDTLWVLSAGLAIYGIFEFSLRQLRMRIVEHVSSSGELRFDQQLLEQIVSLKAANNASIAVMLSRYRDLAVAREGLTSTYLVALADVPFVLVFFVVISMVAWPMGLAFLVMIMLFSVMQLLIKSGQKKIGEESSRTAGQKMELLQDLLGCRDLLRSGLRLPDLRRRWDLLSHRSINLGARYRQAANTGINVTVLFYIVNIIVMLIVGVYLIDARVFSSGALVASSMLASRAISMANSMVMVILKFDDLHDAVKQFAMVYGHGQGQAPTGRAPAGNGTVRLLNIQHKYDEHPVINDISLQITPGEKVAFLGRPGSGKSTLLATLAGALQPTSGQATIDHCPVIDIPLAERSRWLAYKPQEAVLFNGSIEENILAGGNGLHLQEALYVSGLEEDMSSGALSLGTQVGDRGSRLSGGQRQKVALARAIAVNSRILIFDEPTAWLDQDTEQLLLPRWRDWMAERTLLLVTHSAVLLSLVDRIIIIENGCVRADKPRQEVLIN